MKLREIRIKGFKSIVDQAISLGRLNCFIGANGVGKSNVLEALGVLGAAADGRVDDEHIIRNGVRAGLPRLFKTSFAGHRIPPHISLEATGEPAATFRVALRNPLDRPAPAWSFTTEYLSSGEVPVVSRGVRSAKDNLDETRGLSALKVVELGAEAPASQLVKALQAYAIYTPNTPALRAAVADPQPRRPVGLAGGGLAEGFAALAKELDDELLDEVLALVDWVLEIGVTDTVGDLLSPSVPRTKHVLKFTDRFMAASRNTLTAADASEGALYVLFAAVLCLSSSSPSVFAIDNLDAALNPRLVTRLVARLAGWLAATDPDRQLLFTAHNPTVLDGLDLDDDEVRLFAVERNSAGHTTVRRITLAPDLARLHAQYPLSRLWAMGHLGAVPSV
ncbi:MAG: AAA family ATPase [Kofleriaceae bacterium]|jgi:predicted ATPase|nr:AAA family ATPase [Kofleriaceae bacterium]MBP9168812.1 AAA family ATPase [Kofleriaceae bacterium]MBP9863198.1 AAA family ATPase [Kofleriaceae bacterium]